MASYKVDVLKNLGKFHAVLWLAGDAKPNANDTPALDSIGDVIKTVEAEIEERSISFGNDSVAFRGIAYEDPGMLLREIRSGTY